MTLTLSPPPAEPSPGSARLDGTEKRRRLRAAAVQMFSERGVGATSLHSLARKAGIGGARITTYYDGKADLLAEVIHNHLAELALRVDIAAAAEAGTTPELQLVAMVQALLEAVHADRAAHLILLQEQRSLTAAERSLVTTRYDLLALAFGDPMIAAIPALRPRPAFARVVVRSLLGLISSSAVWFQPEGLVDFPTYARMLVRMTLEGGRGLRPRKRRRSPEV